MLQQEKPEEFVICSVYSISLRSIIEYVFNYLDVSLDKIVIDTELYRPTEIADIYGDSSKAKKILGWNYNTSFYDILKILIDEELANGEQRFESELFPAAAPQRF
jgi:GDPmannose 4,6-dehydratase